MVNRNDLKPHANASPVSEKHATGHRSAVERTSAPSHDLMSDHSDTMGSRTDPQRARSDQAFFPLIHIWRGFAALWVVFFHAETLRMADAWTHNLPGWLNDIVFHFGRSGVPVFFVLSGFVITHVVLRTPANWRGFKSFAIKRAIRLDGPYWVAIAASIAVYAVIRMGGGASHPLPSLTNIIAHMLYLQEILHFPAIQVVFWTLAYEVQFYLLTILSWVALSGTLTSRVAHIWLAVLYALALVSATLAQSVDFGGVFIAYWSGFVAGSLAYFYIMRIHRALSGSLLAILCVALAFPARTPAEIFNVPVLLTAVLLVLVGKGSKIGTGRLRAMFDALGTVSYSLYLTHYLVLMVVQGLIFKLMPQLHATGHTSAWRYDDDRGIRPSLAID